MNGTIMEAENLIADLSAALQENADLFDVADVLVCPPFVHIAAVRNEIGDILVGAQDCSDHDNGAYTGQVSASMLKDMGCTHVILGHSERREWLQEWDELIAMKARKAHEAGLVTIICVGESEEMREEGHEKIVVKSQIAGSLPDTATAENTVIAYEPVWAIGTGKTAQPADVTEMHAFIREVLQEKLADSDDMRILYGGSMKPDNAKDLLATPNVDGGLIGGASLDAGQFLEIIRAVKK